MMGASAELAFDQERAIAQLMAQGYRVLSPFRGGARTYHTPDEPVAIARGVFVDTETTGPDVTVDEIIQLAVIPFDYQPDTGQILRVGEALVSYEAPTRAISPEAQAVHGIAMERLVGERHRTAEIVAEFAEADLVIAHNSAFDRPMLDRRFPELPARPWGCSYVDVPWRRAKYPSGSLGALLIEHTEHYFAGHDAADDCYAALHCLAHPLVLLDTPAEATYPLRFVLDELAQARFRVSAVGAPFEVKDALARRGYKWNDPGKAGALPGVPKAWHREIANADLDGEMAWLSAAVYFGRSAQMLAHVKEIPNTARFSRAARA